jgi:hypothetical protein
MEELLHLVEEFEGKGGAGRRRRSESQDLICGAQVSTAGDAT